MACGRRLQRGRAAGPTTLRAHVTFSIPQQTRPVLDNLWVRVYQYRINSLVDVRKNFLIPSAMSWVKAYYEVPCVVRDLAVSPVFELMNSCRI
jgi:hypothetical protein